ncbi:unnamed protein product [Cuscuta europaea]|uniref:No apical meristem-associated C-terminal domain-containing protein n=1 Tax=Cuscuta europaea TaxID=41803 RepID=A0A9P0YU79_CUSEU|nr:unnamed protein product [Cuscuta europaea]
MVMYERLFSGKKKKDFKYIHCWELLIKNPKWCTNQLTKASASDKDDLPNGKSPVADECTPGESSCKELDRLKSDEIVRPQGRKSCKEKKRKLNEEIGMVEAINKFQCTLDKQIELKREYLQKEYVLREQVMKREIELKEHNQKMRDRAQQRADQERIMHLDLSKHPSTVRAKYEIVQAEILKEWESGCFSGI